MKKVLIIEDDQDTSDLLTVLLTEGAEARFKERFAVIQAYSVPEGISKYREERPDVVLLDLGLPDYNGYTFLGRKNDIDRTMRVIVVSAFSTIIDRVTGMQSGCIDYVVKPFEPLRLITVVTFVANANDAEIEVYR